jgi:hypothetical protein
MSREKHGLSQVWIVAAQIGFATGLGLLASACECGTPDVRTQVFTDTEGRRFELVESRQWGLFASCGGHLCVPMPFEDELSVRHVDAATRAASTLSGSYLPGDRWVPAVEPVEYGSPLLDTAAGRFGDAEVRRLVICATPRDCPRRRDDPEPVCGPAGLCGFEGSLTDSYSCSEEGLGEDGSPHLDCAMIREALVGVCLAGTGLNPEEQEPRRRLEALARTCPDAGPTCTLPSECVPNAGRFPRPRSP